jgi:signal transduction histidine kinase
VRPGLPRRNNAPSACHWRGVLSVVSHVVSAMTLQAAGAQGMPAADATDATGVRTALQTVEDGGVQAMGELRRLHGSLRAVDPAALDEGACGVTKLRDIDELEEQASASGPDVDTVVNGTPAPLDPGVDMTADRAVQEAFANTIKHPGYSASVHIHLIRGGERLTLTVRGRGRSRHRGANGRPSCGCGLMSLAEHRVLGGGQFETGALSGSLMVRAELPTSIVAAPRALQALSPGGEQ